jgi:hypothetical protein
MENFDVHSTTPHQNPIIPFPGYPTPSSTQGFKQGGEFAYCIKGDRLIYQVISTFFNF